MAGEARLPGGVEVLKTIIVDIFAPRGRAKTTRRTLFLSVQAGFERRVAFASSPSVRRIVCSLSLRRPAAEATRKDSASYVRLIAVVRLASLHAALATCAMRVARVRASTPIVITGPCSRGHSYFTQFGRLRTLDCSLKVLFRSRRF